MIIDYELLIKKNDIKINKNITHNKFVSGKKHSVP